VNPSSTAKIRKEKTADCHLAGAYSRRQTIFAATHPKRMRKISADLIFDGTNLHRRGTITLDAQGEVMATQWGVLASDAQHLPGLLTPSFVNAHCHLELSHLKGCIPTGTGMAGFIQQVQAQRAQHSEADIIQAATQAAAELLANGVSAVGDICNGPHSIPAKQAHPALDAHNFVEVFGLDPGRAEEIMQQALTLVETFAPHASVTLHAPYSVSSALRDQVLRYARVRAWPQSIHLMESHQERQLFSDLEGPLMDFLRSIGAPFQGHVYDSPQAFILQGLSPRHNTLLVHNTELHAQELADIAANHPNAYFVLCPAANQYIHQKLPDASLFLPFTERVCIGTDSLASNTRLSILHEISLLQQSYGIATATLLRWATSNGARALGRPEANYSIAVGSHPRLIRILDIDPESPTLLPHLPIEPLLP
jgi:aminodeoxyfutalosine deaminase